MRRSACLLALPVLLASPSATAAGFYLTDIGTRGMARAGAFVAAPDSLLAIHYNPAGLALLHGPLAEASLTLVNMDVTFERSCPCTAPSNANAATFDELLESEFKPTVTNSVLAIPFLGVGYGFPFLDLTIAAALWGPNSGRHNFGALPRADSPRFEEASLGQAGRYSGLHMKNVEANFGVGAAFAPIEGLRLGATVMGFRVSNDQTVNLWVNHELLFDSQNPRPEDPALDAPVIFRFTEPLLLNWQVGASYEVLPGLSIGSSFRGKRSVRADGTIDIQLPRKVSEGDTPLVTVEGNEVEAELNTAPLWRTGVEYAVPGVFRTEAAVVFEGWSTHSHVVLRPKDIVFRILGNAQPLPRIAVPREWRDTWSLRLGGELSTLEPLLGVIGGYFYEPSAIPPDRLDAARIDLDKHGVSLGVRTTFYGFTLEVSGMFIALRSIEVTDSKQQITAPLEGTDDFRTAVGNGRYGGHYFIGSASLSFELDPPAGAS